MRKILRVAAKSFVVFLWIVKGLLLVLAVGVLVLWPMSRGRWLWIVVDRATVDNDSSFIAGCRNGRVSIGRDWANFVLSNEGFSRLGLGWTWEAVADSSGANYLFAPSAWGLFGWQVVHEKGPPLSLDHFHVSAPCWLVAPVLALWPLTSFTLLIRRRRRCSRRELLGCCQKCGYDLRATAEKPGPLLARCPECGADVPAVSTH